MTTKILDYKISILNFLLSWRSPPSHLKKRHWMIFLSAPVFLCSQALRAFAVKVVYFMARGICRGFFVKFLAGNFPGN